jgi:hypothetical protein
MAKRKRATADRLLTLSEVGTRTGISMPSLLRYKKRFQGRIPAVGKGRKQRYPESALPVFEAIRTENLGRRGRPKGSGRQAVRKVEAATGAKLLSLNEIGRRTKISYPTLLRYVKNHLPELAHRGSGRMRRFLPESVAVFERLRSQSRRGRKAAGARAAGARAAGAPSEKAVLRRLDQIEKLQHALSRQLRDLARAAGKPLRIVVKR